MEGLEGTYFREKLGTVQCFRAETHSLLVAAGLGGAGGGGTCFPPVRFNGLA